MEEKKIVFIGVPAYSRSLEVSTPNNLNSAGMSCVWQIEISSLLARCFNTLLCSAFNRRKEFGITHFCLMHADIEIKTPGWAEKMIGIMQSKGLDVLSAVVPIKQDNGDTSTALDVTPEKRDITLLCMNDIMRLPPTFNRSDCKQMFGNDGLLINTALMMIRLDAIDPLKHHFHIVDEIKLDNGRYHPAGCPEDWHISRKFMRDGVKYGATREIEINHWGYRSYNNQETYGREGIIKKDPFAEIGRHEDRWLEKEERDETGAVDVSASIEKCRNAIDAMEMACEVHPMGPTIIILKGKGWSNARIGKKIGMSDVHVKRLLDKITQTVEAQTP